MVKLLSPSVRIDVEIQYELSECSILIGVKSIDASPGDLLSTEASFAVHLE